MLIQNWKPGELIESWQHAHGGPAKFTTEEIAEWAVERGYEGTEASISKRLTRHLRAATITHKGKPINRYFKIRV